MAPLNWESRLPPARALGLLMALSPQGQGRRVTLTTRGSWAAASQWTEGDV